MSAAEDQKQYVPTGVNAQSWIGFEHRIQERRYRALLQQIAEAVLLHDGIAARLALEEARELRPEAPELIGLSEQIASIPLAPLPSFNERLVWSRAMNAVSLLVAGVALLVAIEWVRTPPPLPSARTIASTVVTTSAPTVDSAASTPPTEFTPPVPGDAALSSTEPDVALPDPVATGGIQPAINIARPAVGGPARATFRPQAIVEPGDQTSGREISDNDAAAESRSTRETNAAVVENIPTASASADTAPRQQPKLAEQPRDIREALQDVTPPAPALLASVPAAPTPITLVPPAAPAVSSRAAVIEPRPRVPEEARVTQVLDQYARAYGQLDVRAARRVWPTVDERALARAFAGLQSQNVSFDNCNVNVSGAKATASCRGRATYVGKIGSREPRTEARQWTFELRRDADDAWEIERAQAQRMAN